jgi:hypothetical protein
MFEVTVLENEQLVTIINEIQKPFIDTIKNMQETLTNTTEKMNALSIQMEHTTTMIRTYNGLVEKVHECEKRIALSEDKADKINGIDIRVTKCEVELAKNDGEDQSSSRLITTAISIGALAVSAIALLKGIKIKW